MSRPTTHVHDPRVLRAIAHPLRNRILAELDAQGSMRAADVARELDIPANQASFHLRQLAKYGLVEEDPDAARDRRDRVWRSSGVVTVRLRELEESPGGRAAADVYRRNGASWGHLVVDRVYAADRPADAHHSLAEGAVRLTREEAAQLAEEIGEVVARWTERTQAEPAEGRRTYLSLNVLLPYPESRDPDDGARR